MMEIAFDNEPERKVVYFIRHAQSIYNALGDLTGPQDPMVFDCGLSELGNKQVAEALPIVRKLPHLDVILVSPLTRTIETCLGVFKERLSTTRVEVCLLARERVSGSDDLGRSPQQLSEAFPNLKFDAIQHNVWWHTEGHDDKPNQVEASYAAYKVTQWKEPDDVFKPRVAKLKKYLFDRPESCFALVSHWDTLTELLGVGVQNCQIMKTTFDVKTKKIKVEGPVK